MSSSVVLLAKQDIPNLEADFRSKVLEELVADKSSLEACAEEVFNKDDVEEIEPILGTSSINGLEPDGGEDPVIIFQNFQCIRTFQQKILRIKLSPDS